MTACFYCGADERAELHEVWDSREFMLDACCEAFHEDISWGLANDPEWAGAFLRRIAVEDVTGFRLRRLADDGGCGLILDWNLELEPIAFDDARAFVAEHHMHCRPPAAWRFGQAIRNGPDLLGVVVVGRPTARAIDQRNVVEVTRLCVRRDVPSALRWNACSSLYGWSAREAKRRGLHKIITYTRHDEDGASVCAAGWTLEGTGGGRSWNWRGRPRVDHDAPCTRMRWSRTFQAAVDRAPAPARTPTEPPLLSGYRTIQL